MGKRSKSRSRRKPRSWDWYLLTLLALAIVVLSSFVWFLLRQRGVEQSEPIDFADRLRQLAAARGADRGGVVADDPIRKVDGVFVRSWRITLPDRASAAALRDDIAAEAELRRATLSEASIAGGAPARLRVDLGGEAFAIDLLVAAPVVRQPTARPRRPPTATPRPPPPNARGRLAILLDDAGYSTELVEEAAALPAAVGVAVLPFLPHSSEIAGAMHRSGHEVWLHLPMEPNGSSESDPGPGALMVSMSEDEIRRAVHAALNSVPHVVGANNHMGSRFTEDLRAMTWVMQELKARGMRFVDSRTTPRTVAEDAARAQGVPVGRRHVFLDNERTGSAVRRQLDEAVQRCRSEGDTIAIGHLARVTVDVLRRDLETLAGRGADLVPPSALVR